MLVREASGETQRAAGAKSLCILARRHAGMKPAANESPGHEELRSTEVSVSVCLVLSWCCRDATGLSLNCLGLFRAAAPAPLSKGTADDGRP